MADRQPAALLIAKGSHIAKEELARRAEAEIKVPFTDVQPPEYLPEHLHEKFWDIAHKLLAIGIFTELDVDVLARYLMSEEQFIKLSAQLDHVIDEQDSKNLGSVSRAADTAFKQCHQSASALGLTITSRCKMVVPEVPQKRETKFSKFET